MSTSLMTTSYRLTVNFTLLLILYCQCVNKTLCASTDETIYQDLLSGKRSLAAVGKVNDRVILVVQPTNGSIPLNDTYVFEAAITNDDYTELVLQNGELIGEHWPNFPALTQPLLSAYFLRDQGNNYFFIVCQKQDPPDFIDCQAYQVEGANASSLHQVTHLPKLKMNYSTPTMMTDTGGAELHSFDLYNAGPDNVHLVPYTYPVDNPGGLLDQSINWVGGDTRFVLCEMNQAQDQVRMVDSYWNDCTTLGLVVFYVFLDEHHATFFANGTILRMNRFGTDGINNQWVRVQRFTWQQFFRVAGGSSSSSNDVDSESNGFQPKSGLSVGGIVAIAVIATFLVTVALAVAIFFLCRPGSSFTSTGGGGGSSKSGRKSGKKATANTPQKSNKMAKSKATSKK